MAGFLALLSFLWWMVVAPVRRSHLLFDYVFFCRFLGVAGDVFLRQFSRRLAHIELAGDDIGN